VRSVLGGFLDALTGYLQVAAATNGWIDAVVVKTLKESIQRAPLDLANVAGLLIVLALSLYVVFIPFWIWLHRWALKLDREAYRDLTGGTDWNLDWIEEAKAAGDKDRPRPLEPDPSL
jgi:hypothetical protein